MALKDLRKQCVRRTPDQMIKHLNKFELDLKFSAGIWFFAPGGGRFHDRYIEDQSIEERLEVAAGLVEYGLAGMEAHYPNEINEDNLDTWKKCLKQAGLKMPVVVPNLFFDSAYEWGALSSPIKKVRQEAIERVVTTLQLAKEVNAEHVVVWPGIDGFENPFGQDFYAARDRFCQGLAEAMDRVPGVRVAEEPKPYEPRGHIYYGTTAEGLLMAAKVEAMLTHRENKRLLKEGHSLVCMNPETGHMLMGYEDLAYAFSLIMEYGKLAHTHWNSQPLGNYDQDLNVGVISPEQTEAALYVLKMHGYNGWFGIDINPERMSVKTALINCMDALRAANDRINSLDHEKVILSTANPEKNRGWLEAYLIRERAKFPKKLAPLPRFTK